MPKRMMFSGNLVQNRHSMLIQALISTMKVRLDVTAGMNISEVGGWSAMFLVQHTM